ncbi:H-NS family nucleoid-associated regulatory protein [Escherichia coli]|nr:H-NS family nucleoid-associated regulatory protein [Escherichia coli]
MSEALKALNNIHFAHARETNLATLEEMLEKLTTIVEDRREEENSARKEQEERQAKLEAFPLEIVRRLVSILQNYSLQLVHPSLKPNQLVLLVLLNTKYTDENGNEQTWTGQGQPPKAIAAAISFSKTLEDFAI